MKLAKALILAVPIFVALPTLVGCATTTTSTAQRESAGEYIDDATITTRVKLALANDSRTSATQISVETYRGVVQLSGFVDSEAMATRAVEVAKAVPGVRSVKNDIRTKSATR